jgi:hypothetical protein
MEAFPPSSFGIGLQRHTQLSHSAILYAMSILTHPLDRFDAKRIF